MRWHHGHATPSPHTHPVLLRCAEPGGTPAETTTTTILHQRLRVLQWICQRRKWGSAPKKTVPYRMRSHGGHAVAQGAEEYDVHRSGALQSNPTKQVVHQLQCKPSEGTSRVTMTSATSSAHCRSGQWRRSNTEDGGKKMVHTLSYSAAPFARPTRSTSAAQVD